MVGPVTLRRPAGAGYGERGWRHLAFAGVLAPPACGSNHPPTSPTPTLCRYIAAAHTTSLSTFAFSVTLPDASEFSCATFAGAVDAGYAQPPTNCLSGEFWGLVTEAGATSLSVETCPAGAACKSIVYRVDIATSGLNLGVPIGRPVTVGYWINNWGASCQQQLVIKDGLAGSGTVITYPAWWFAGADSAWSPPLAVPFRVTRQELFCNPAPSLDQGCGGNDVPPDDYALAFAQHVGDTPLVLGTGETGDLPLTYGTDGLQHLSMHVLRSYQTTVCDDYANWAWWAVGHAGPNGDPD
jgi:hypothetical protein